MSLPPFATTDEFRDRLPAGTEFDESRAGAWLADASDLIRDEAGDPNAWTTDGALDADRPPGLMSLCCKVARRGYLSRGGLRSQSITDFAETWADVDELWLTDDEKARIRRWAGRTGLWVQDTTRTPADGAADTVYLDCVNAETGHDAGTIPFMPADW